MAIKKYNRLTGIILSGGAGKRMKREKGLCLLDGKPMISYVLNILGNTCSELMISANNSVYDNMGIRVVRDEIRNIGPLGGISACLKKSKTEDNLIVSCDMPFISEELIRYIIDSSADFQVVIPVFNGFAEPLCAYYKLSIIPILDKMIEQKVYKIQEIARFAKTLFLDISPRHSFYTGHLFSNINSPNDLALAEKELKAKHAK